MCRFLAVFAFDWKKIPDTKSANLFDWLFFAFPCSMRSIIDHFKGSREFPRLRIGMFQKHCRYI